MKIENPAALRFIIEDDLYLLAGDKIAAQIPVIQSISQQPVAVSVPQIPVAPSVPQTSAIEAVTIPPINQPQPETPVIDFKYKGGNKKGFLVLVHYPAIDFIEDAHLAALENILKRKELSLDDVAIMNLAKYPNHDKTELLGFFKPGRLLIMGKDAIPATVTAPALNQLGQAEGIQTLYSFSFAEMMDSNENKKAFWDQMKNL